MPQSGHHEGAVEVLVEALARALGDEEARVASGPLEVPVVAAHRLVVRADGVGGAQSRAVPGPSQMPVQSPPRDRSATPG